MDEPQEPTHPIDAGEIEQPRSPAGVPGFTVTLDAVAGVMRFDWTESDGAVSLSARLQPTGAHTPFHVLRWVCEPEGIHPVDSCLAAPVSTHALLRRIRKRYPIAVDTIRFGLVAAENMGLARAGERYLLKLPPGIDRWAWLNDRVRDFAGVLDDRTWAPASKEDRGRLALTYVTGMVLASHLAPPESGAGPAGQWFALRLTIDTVEGSAEFAWSDPKTGKRAATGGVRLARINRLAWELEIDGGKETAESAGGRKEIRTALQRWLDRFPPDWETFSVAWRNSRTGLPEAGAEPGPQLDPDVSPVAWIEENLMLMVEMLSERASPLGRMMEQMDFESRAAAEHWAERRERKEQQRREEAERRQALIAARLAERKRRDEQARQSEAIKTPVGSPGARAPAAVPRPAPAGPPAAARLLPTAPRSPTPPVPVTIKAPSLTFQDTVLPLSDLTGYGLRERAAQWWVSNQSDDLLCLPNCRIEHLDFQLRAALRVLGPLRGRALLSDEVGLGKTIEAGIVIKELLTRGMIKRFLVLTLPSLVDQWEEELGEKFGLSVVTTNQTDARADAASFWRDHTALVASLHTLKQPAHLAVAREVHWDLLIVDEAHYLRNRTSQAWQAINVLPRHYLLLLTATPVQNSLDELYNLVTLLQPGQLSSPREFRAQFFDPKHPREPRNPTELRRLLSQVMIRNTRANSGIQLPPRRAETVLFEPGGAEREFWGRWEEEFRAALARLSASQASLWGRLLLQARGAVRRPGAPRSRSSPSGPRRRCGVNRRRSTPAGAGNASFWFHSRERPAAP